MTKIKQALDMTLQEYALNETGEEFSELSPENKAGMRDQHEQEKHDQTYSTDELTDTFKVIGFGYGYCAVEHKETGEKGSFDFKTGEDGKRVYFNYVKAYKYTKGIIK